ncbi:MAG: orotidine-5'-phosphate decarboxylase [Candidatus Omnitrophica bacterium]|nr:orotidine-5'-phosphate decarboxylase [Candidatus Omnitrophota bacterium]
MQKINDKIIVALDVDTDKQAKRFVDRLHPAVKIFKIGPVLFTAYGPKAIGLVRKKGAEVFLDLKFHDIPNTVAHAVRQAARLEVKMLTLHTSGGEEMLMRAAQAAKEESAKLNIKKPFLLGITVLTSDKSAANTKKTVLARARLAKKAGLDGIVCSVHEARAVRKACGKNFIIVTPGIRPKTSRAGDQKRVATAKDAFSAGADYIVVGRPILEAADPLKAARDIIKE